MAFVFLSLVIGIIAWTAGLIAVSQYTEDLCFDDLEGRSGLGSYRSEETLWPPSFECWLNGSDAEPIAVQHRLVALARLGVAVVFPVVYVVVATLVIVSWFQRRQTSSDQAQHQATRSGL
jgi:Na+-transporting methylmalonyl-CoA/oxaloacetate decarboxylase gamma subunit